MQPRRDGVLAWPSVPQLFADLEPVGFFLPTTSSADRMEVHEDSVAETTSKEALTLQMIVASKFIFFVVDGLSRIQKLHAAQESRRRRRRVFARIVCDDPASSENQMRCAVNGVRACLLGPQTGKPFGLSPRGGFQ
jgi:hypothetical protein